MYGDERFLQKPSLQELKLLLATICFEGRQYSGVVIENEDEIFEDFEPNPFLLAAISASREYVRNRGDGLVIMKEGPIHKQYSSMYGNYVNREIPKREEPKKPFVEPLHPLIQDSMKRIMQDRFYPTLEERLLMEYVNLLNA